MKIDFSITFLHRGYLPICSLHRRVLQGLLASVFLVLSQLLFAANENTDAKPIKDFPLRIVYEETLQDMQPGIALEVRQAGRVSDGLALIDKTLLLDTELTIRFGAEDGPLFDPEIFEIMMPDSFSEEIAKRFSADLENVSDEELLFYVEDVILHTLLHEMGHALIEMYQIPVLGREEDAADSMGTVFLTEYFENGGEIALTAGDMFALESSDRDELEQADFWGDHSLDEQRYYKSICHVYGSNPDENAELVDSGELDGELADGCIFEYEKTRQDWLYLLEDYLQ